MEAVAFRCSAILSIRNLRQVGGAPPYAGMKRFVSVWSVVSCGAAPIPPVPPSGVHFTPSLLPLTNPPKEGGTSDVPPEHPAQFQENTGNRKPETGNEKKLVGLRFAFGEYAPNFLRKNLGPRGFEPLTYGCLRPCIRGGHIRPSL